MKGHTNVYPDLDRERMQAIMDNYFRWCKQGRVPKKWTTFIGAWIYTKIATETRAKVIA